MGIRQSFGLFLPQMSVALDMGRESFGLAIAISNLLFGLVQPFVGALADKHGDRAGDGPHHDEHHNIFHGHAANEHEQQTGKEQQRTRRHVGKHN